MAAIHVEVTAEDVAAAGSWPRGEGAVQGWKSPVELALGRLAGVDVDVDGDEESWHATIGTMQGSTLVFDLPGVARERLDFYYAHDGVLMDPLSFNVELDDWLVSLIAGASTAHEPITDSCSAVVRRNLVDQQLYACGFPRADGVHGSVAECEALRGKACFDPAAHHEFVEAAAS